jgi:hypothetical protein
MSDDQRRYISYLLRLWQTQHAGALVWRASLQSASNSDARIGIGRPGERRGFASLAELFDFLEQETAPADEGDPRLPAESDMEAQEVGATEHTQSKHEQPGDMLDRLARS